MNTTHRVIMNTGILYARMAITVLLSLYTTRVVLGALGVKDFGIFNLVGGTIAMLTFLNAAMAASTQRFMSFAQGKAERQHQIFNVSVVLHIGIAILVMGILQFAGLFLFDGVFNIEPERREAAWMVYQFAAVSTFFTILAVPYDAVINAREHMILFAVLGVVEAILKLVIALVIAEDVTAKLELYGFLIAVLSVVLWLLRVGYCRRKYYECKFAPRIYFDRPLFKEMTAFAGWSLLGAATSMLANYGQILVLNIFFGTAINAAQAIAIQLSGLLCVFSATMLRALAPLIAKSEGAGNRELMLRASSMGSKVSFFLLVLMVVPVLVEIPYLLKLWLKVLPEYTVNFCVFLLLIKLIEQLYITLASSVAAVGNIKRYQIITSLLTLFPLPFSYLLFKFGFPPFALYVVFLIYTLLLLVVTLYFAKVFCGLSVRSYVSNVVFRCVAVFVLLMLVTVLPLLILEQGIVRFLVGMLVFLVTMPVVTWWVGFDEKERLQILELIRGGCGQISAPKNISMK